MLGLEGSGELAPGHLHLLLNTSGIVFEARRPVC